MIKLIQKGWMEHLEAYKQHCIDQAITILEAGHDVRCMFTTPPDRTKCDVVVHIRRASCKAGDNALS